MESRNNLTRPNPAQQNNLGTNIEHPHSAQGLHDLLAFSVCVTSSDLSCLSADGTVLLELQAKVAEPLPRVLPGRLPPISAGLHHGRELVITYFSILTKSKDNKYLVVRMTMTGQIVGLVTR